LGRLEEMAKMTKTKIDDDNKFIASCCKEQQLVKFHGTTLPSLNTKLKLRRRKVPSPTEEVITDIKYLEDRLTAEVDHLRSTKRAKQIFEKHLEMERTGHIPSLLGEIQASIVPAPSTLNGSDFTYSLLDGSAEIVLTKISTLYKIDEDEGVPSRKSMELGCFLKGGGAAMKLLRGILLGSIKVQTEETAGPFLLRESLSSMIFQDESEYPSFLQMTHMFSRIDTLVRTVRDLETKGFCAVKDTANGDATLSIAMHHEGTVVQIRFWFCNLTGKDWHFTTVPRDVKVFIVSTDQRRLIRGNQLQEQAQSMLADSHCDPILLRRICENVMEIFSQSVKDII